MVDISYGVLFQLELLHRYYRQLACPDFQILPSLSTQGLLAGYQVVAKQYQHRLYAGVQQKNQQPALPLADNLVFTFFLYLKNALFFNYTNLPVAHPPGKLYYFTNRNGTTANGKNFLSQNIQAFSATRTYQPGDLAADGSGVVYVAVRAKESSNPVSFPDPGYWAKADNGRYLSERDALQWLPSVSTYTFSSLQTAANIQVRGYNTATGNYTTVVLATTVNFSRSLASFRLDLSPLPQGKYELTVNGEKQLIYLNDELVRQRPFAVIEIYQEPTLPAASRLLDAEGKLLSPVYTLSFLNRFTLWKYVLRNGLSGTITDTAGVYNFSGAGNTVFSSAPIPLNERALNLTLHIGPREFTRIACATPERLSVCTRDSVDYSCSEIFLNH